jgi:hypothetical protein
MIAEVDEIFPVFILQGSTIGKIVKLRQIFQFAGKKSA